jgi:hypothetical protein
VAARSARDASGIWKWLETALLIVVKPAG